MQNTRVVYIYISQVSVNVFFYFEFRTCSMFRRSGWNLFQDLDQWWEEFIFLFFRSETSNSGWLMTVLDKSYFLATGITLSVCSKDHSHPISTNSTLNETVLHSGMSKKAFWILTKVEPKGSHTLIGGPADQSGFRNSEVRSESLKICWNCKMGAVLISIFFLYNSSA